MHPRNLILSLPALLCMSLSASSAPMGTAFDYRGRLNMSGLPAQGPHDFQFILYDSQFGGTNVGPTNALNYVNVTNGMFTVCLDFGAITNTFNGEARWLQIAVQTNGGSGFTTLSPRQPVPLSPYALFARVAGDVVAPDIARLDGNGVFTGTVTFSRMAGDVVAPNIARLDSNGVFTGTVTFNPSTGAPFLVGNASPVSQLNADLLDGAHANAFQPLIVGFPDSLTVNRQIQVGQSIQMSPWSISVNTVTDGFGQVHSNMLVFATGTGWKFALETSGEFGTPSFGVDPDGTMNVSGPWANFEHNVQVDGSMSVNGDLSVSGTKHFVQPHPSDPTKEIVYSCLEGPESGTYVRGSAGLTNGEAVIELPAHFSMVTGENGVTAQVSPRGEWMQLYVVAADAQRIVVREAQGRNGRFDYLVQGLRRGYENKQVIRDRILTGGVQ